MLDDRNEWKVLSSLLFRMSAKCIEHKKETTTIYKLIGENRYIYINPGLQKY